MRLVVQVLCNSLHWEFSLSEESIYRQMEKLEKYRALARLVHYRHISAVPALSSG